MSVNTATLVGQVVKKAREKERLTQQDLSDKAGISRNYISDIECGRYTPSVDTLLSIASVLKIDLNLLKNDGNTI